MTTPEDILDFWFGPPHRCFEDLLASLKRWGPALDAEIRDRFGAVIERGLAGDLDSFTATQHGTLALVLVIDQFPRHAFRGSARQYEGDPKALRLCLEAWDDGWPWSLPYPQALYLLLPLAHAENLEIQERHVEIAKRLAAEAPAWAGEFGVIPEEQSRKYHAIIARFGRFPHRNAMLGRSSTDEEREWLASGALDEMPPALVRRLIA